MTQIKFCGITRREDAEYAIDLGVDALGFNFWPGSKRAIASDKAKEIIGMMPVFIDSVGIFVNQSPHQIHTIHEQCGISAIQLHGDEIPETVKYLPKIPVIRAFRHLTIKHALQEWKEYKVTFLVDGGAHSISIADSILEHIPGSLQHKITYGGSGQTADDRLVKFFLPHGRIILAGGLHADNVAECIRAYRPFAVDVASGIESAPGIKDRTKMRDFVAAVRSVDAELLRTDAADPTSAI